MSEKITVKIDVDPFKGYPMPHTPRWVRFTVWAMLAVLLAMLVLAKYWR